MSETAQSQSTEIDAIEPCPTPLDWQEVVRSFQNERREGEVEFPGGRVTVTQFGSGQPLIVLPGTVGSPRLFALTAWILRDEFQTWVFDQPKFQKTPSTSDFTQATATAYSTVCRELFPEPVDCYASTYGAQVAIRMMIDTPEDLKNVVLQSGWAHRKLTSAERVLLNVGAPFSLRLKRVPFWLSAQIANHRPWFPPYDETRFGFLLAETYKTPINEYSQRMRAAGQTDLSNVLNEIRNNVLLVRTEGDGQAIGLEEDVLEQRIPGCQSEAMHTCGHFPFLTHPHRLAKILRQFYNSETSEIHAPNH